MTLPIDTPDHITLDPPTRALWDHHLETARTALRPGLPDDALSRETTDSVQARVRALYEEARTSYEEAADLWATFGDDPIPAAVFRRFEDRVTHALATTDTAASYQRTGGDYWASH